MWALASAFWTPAPASSAPAAERPVRFDAAPSGGALASGAGEPIQGYLTKPTGHGPFPAVVVLHSCLGLRADRRSIADAVAGWGYAALFVDEFAGRGLRETCSRDFPEGTSDAFGALRYLSGLPFVDQHRIAVLGYSQGADIALTVASRPAFASGGPEFKAAAAFYPPCANQGNARLEIPTLILIGAADDVTPAADCARLAQAQGSASMAKLIVYPGAFHGFDDPAFAGGRRMLGMRLQYDRAAAERSRSELRDFLARALAR